MRSKIFFSSTSVNKFREYWYSMLFKSYFMVSLSSSVLIYRFGSFVDGFSVSRNIRLI